MELHERIRKARKAAGLTQGAVAAHFNIRPVSVTQWESGKSRPDMERMGSLARLLNVPLGWLAEGDESAELSSEDVAAGLSESPRPRTVKLKGYVGAGSEAHFYKISDEDFEEVPAPPNATDKTVAVEIRGKSWGPLMDTFRVYYDDVHSPIDASMFGRPCIVGLADDRILLKVPFPQQNGMFRLVSNSDEPPIEDAIIEWAALVKSFMPKT
jgi:transcriptional regulator with XRE-family HTH domain